MRRRKYTPKVARLEKPDNDQDKKRLEAERLLRKQGQPTLLDLKGGD